MKSFYYLFCCCGLSAVSTVSAQNLYEIASSSGLENSIPLKWNASVNAGYDDNVNSVSRSNAAHQSSSFTSINVGASMSDMDARTQFSFDGRVGGIFYLDKMRFGSNQVVSNTSLSAMLNHVIDPTLKYNASATIAYQPEPDYQSGITAPRRMGDYLHVYFNNSISKALTNRFSTTTGASISMLDYQEAIAETENKTHFGLSQLFRYKWTPRAAVNLEWRGNYTSRKFGYDSFSNFVLVGGEYAIDKHTNATLKVGPQFKRIIGGNTDTTLCLEGAVDRMIADKLVLGMFVRLANESTETYSMGESYEKNMASRVGVRATYCFTPIWTLAGNVNLVRSDFSQGNGIYTPDRTETTWNFSAQLDCKLRKDLVAYASYSFTNGQYSGGSSSRPSYLRNVFTLGTRFNF